MVDVHILTSGLGNYKSRTFLFPVLRYKQELVNRGTHITIFNEVHGRLTNCDVLIIEQQCYRYDEGPYTVTLDDIRSFSEEVPQLLYFDNSDSTGGIRPGVLALVDGYYKNQLLVDKEPYLEPMNGDRPHSDYYHTEHGITDSAAVQTPNEPQVAAKEHLEKLGVSWNLGMIPHFPYAKYVWHSLDKAPEWLCRNLPWNTLLQSSVPWASPARQRSVDISGRFSTSYDRQTIQFHRELIEEALAGSFESTKLGQLDYWKELRNAKILLSPFGYGEVCFRDFEGFMSGCLVVKPSTDHMETWPPLYTDGETMVDVDWDMDTLGDAVAEMLQSPQERQEIATRGQERYQEYLIGDSARTHFINHFEGILREY